MPFVDGEDKLRVHSDRRGGDTFGSGIAPHPRIQSNIALLLHFSKVKRGQARWGICVASRFCRSDRNLSRSFREIGISNSFDLPTHSLRSGQALKVGSTVTSPSKPPSHCIAP
jgi:hypothetical protein